MLGTPQSRREGEEELPASLPRRFLRPRSFVPAILGLGMAALFWPVRQLRSENFVFYFPSGVRLLALESVGNAKYLPLLQVLNMVGKVGGIQEKKNSLKVWFGSNQIELTSNQPNVQIGNASYNLTHPVHVTDGQWMVPVDFLTTVLPHLTHQTAEYQEGTDRIFMGDVKFASFSVRVDPLPDGARLSVQFTDKVAVRTASSNGKWVVFLGNHPMQPVEPSYHFQNPYLSQLQYDDQDGVPKLILSPAATGLNFYPAMAKGGRVLLADIVKPPSPVAQGVPQQAAPVPRRQIPHRQQRDPRRKLRNRPPPRLRVRLFPSWRLMPGMGATTPGLAAATGCWERTSLCSMWRACRQRC